MEKADNTLPEEARIALEACGQFFREVMPKLNIAQSAIRGDDIVIWNHAEMSLKRWRRTVSAAQPPQGEQPPALVGGTDRADAREDQ